MRNAIASRTLLAGLIVLSTPLQAQTDYYNTDRGRPLRTEDAYPVERRAFEIQAAPLRLERASGGVYRWSVEPEIAYGILPRTQVELGVPFSVVDAAAGRQAGAGGIHASVLHNLNVETSIPAFALSAAALLPVGEFAPDDPYFSFRGIATRTFTWARFHVNGEYTVGEETADVSASELARWSAGLAVDRTFPLRSLLLGAELVVEQPIVESEDQVVIAGAGFRYQLSPRWAMDAGAGKRMTGDDRSWYVTVGSAYAFGLPWRR
ncbi:MAG TPA: transporter [Gemmatimonadaceae bacterium]|nr:transporter [Gemmatimonadaceae bacterium]